jgi:hypothetical protein
MALGDGTWFGYNMDLGKDLDTIPTYGRVGLVRHAYGNEGAMRKETHLSSLPRILHLPADPGPLST